MHLPAPREASRRRPAVAPVSAPAGRTEVDALHAIATLVAEHAAPDILLRTILEAAAELAGVSDGYVYLRAADDDSLVVHAGIGLFERYVGFTLPSGDGVAGRVAETGEPLAVADYASWEGRAHALDPARFHAVVGVPLHGRQRVEGVIGLARTERGIAFGSEEITVLDRFGRLAAIALENARLHQRAAAERRERRRTEEELLDTVARLSRSEHSLRQAQAEMIRRLADAAEFRDAETGRHTGRMARMCETIARRLGLDDERCRLLRDASPLHDIGKIAIPDDILLKPDGFTEAEREVMRRHAEIGHRLLSGSASEVLDMAATIALTHHERWDGTGYPRGLAGEAIPLEGRIAAVADVFDALTADRVYRPALTVDEALAVMRKERGGQFDPVVLDALEAHVRGLEDSAEPDDTPAPEPADDDASDTSRASTADGSTAPAEISEEALDQACRTAERVLEGSRPGRHAIGDALALLCEPFGGTVLASVYAVDHDRLWLVSQAGYVAVLDGFPVGQGVMGRAARTGVPQLVRDVSGDGDFVAAVGGISSEVALPFGAGPRPVGVLNVETVGRVLPRTSARVLARLAVLLESRVDELREGIDSEVGALLRLCVHASSLRGVEPIAELAARTTGRILGLESAQLDLWRAEDARPRLASFWRRHGVPLQALPEDVLLRVDIAVGAEVTAGVVGAAEAGLDGDEADAIVVLPLRAGGAAIGLVTGRLVGPAPEQERLEAATLFVQHAAALIDVATALRREQRAAVTDQLTGLLNRRGFEERFQEEIVRAARDGVPVSIALCDCDGLKAMNDTHGHATGDALLEVVASCLRSSKRTSDVAARLGGDEFALILPDTDAGAALAVADRVRRSLAESRVAGTTPRASFGVASYPVNGHSTAELLRSADAALYREKHLARGRRPDA